MNIDPKMRVSEIASRFPQTLEVFRRYRIDLCCGGARSLSEVAGAHKLDLRKLLEELEASLKK